MDRIIDIRPTKDKIAEIEYEPQPAIKMRDAEVGVCWFQTNDLMTEYKTHADSYCPDYYAAKRRKGRAIIEKRYKN